ncbi:hypothetical protein [Nocardioides dongkuii]|uniref:hypothetical protein n=1 Tax=Nocardioides dongkuii TaxID=2760089 RepID=UPI0015F92278|nr:hypothetical protein [Nocardioides dongkuii]
MPPLTTEDIIEAIIDELAIGELGQSVDSVRIDRVGSGTLMLDYGDAGRFRLDVSQQSE